MTGCPAGQEIPRYLEYTARGGDFEKAYETIIATNPFPNVQGKVCDHMCMSKCTRINYERPLLIREIKRYIADKFDDTRLTPAPPSNGIKVSIIGAGPSGSPVLISSLWRVLRSIYTKLKTSLAEWRPTVSLYSGLMTAVWQRI